MAQIEISDTQLQQLKKLHPELKNTPEALVLRAIANHVEVTNKRRNQPQLPKLR